MIQLFSYTIDPYIFGSEPVKYVKHHRRFFLKDGYLTCLCFITVSKDRKTNRNTSLFCFLCLTALHPVTYFFPFKLCYSTPD